MKLLGDGALQVRYTPPQTPVLPELPFWNAIPNAVEAWRGAMMKAADDCTELTPRSLRIKDRPECTAATVRVQPRAVALDANYEPAQAFSDGGLLAFTGHYTVLLKGHALRWRWVMPADGYVVQAGTTYAQRQTPAVEQLVPVTGVAQALTAPSYTTVRLVGAHQYVWLGHRAPEQLPDGGGSLVLDPLLDAERAQRIRRALLADMAALKDAYSQAPVGPVGVLVPVTQASQFRGDTTGERMMRLQLPQKADTMPGHGLERFIAHEVTHWWNSGVVQSDFQRPWLHEGHAEWAAQLLLHQAGLTSTQAVRSSVEGATTTCLLARGDTPAVRRPPGFADNQDPYACGLALMVLAQAMHHALTPAQTPTQPATTPLHELASLHPRDAVLDVAGFARWADSPSTSAEPITMQQLLINPNQGFASGYLALAQRVGLGSTQPLDDAGLSSNPRMQLGNMLLQQLLQGDCQGPTSFSWQTDGNGYKLGERMTCQHARLGLTVTTVEGLSLVVQPVKAWQAAAQACAQGRPVQVGYADGVATPSPCPARVLVLPTTQWLKLVPDALARLGVQEAGSGLQINSLSPTQVDNLVLLGQVWGFLKYHHPAVRSGQHQWDDDLLRQVPAVLAAPDRATAAASLVRWVDALGTVPPCDPCVTAPKTAVHFAPALAWLQDSARLTPTLSQRLLHIHRNRPATGKQFYVSLAPQVDNPLFDNEPPHDGVPLADRGYRLLSVFRFWNDIEYWFPYRDLIGENWHTVLADAIPRVVLAPSDLAYQQALIALVARVNDTHTALWSAMGQRPPVGMCRIPINARFVEGRVIVSQAEEAGPLRRGDELLAIDGQTIPQLLRERAPYYAASNEPTRQRDFARDLNRGPCTAPAEVRVVHADGSEQVLQAPRIPNLKVRRELTHDRPGEPFQLLSPDVAYLKLTNVKAADLPGYVRAAAGTKGLVVDIRNYPEFLVFPLGGLLVTQPTPFVRFIGADLDNPGQFISRGEPISIRPAQAPQPIYAGKLVILVDETTQSRAEYTAMALRTVPGARVVGSTTAGADGDFSQIKLPGGQQAGISGTGVFYPDGRPTQRVGIMADIPANPTVQGLRVGRDEVLEAGLRAILGEGVSAGEIERMSRQ